ncbi:MAG: amidohydrolase family protein [Hungatella hathewayi]|uniref:N-acyl-D-amino-acid deacylase family protein n=1 Tax=Hungatella TaxID=1649459 RepID=UPI001105ECA1|nr:MULTISPECIES: amidohydrolase family protein [Hungatella]MCI7383273.1 amidohydrolase family protein [Hungatella sp.]MDY6238447.1 amidohydrolase family protein [Hungatella hathewayi]
MRTLIKNGLVYDGSGDKPFRKDILIRDGVIEAVTENAETAGTEAPPADSGGLEVIDAKGLVVTPGFIDTHRHCDIDALYNPEFGRLEMAQGLTTVIGGNCGLAPIPAPKKYRRAIYDFIEPCLGIAPEEMALERFSDYLEELGKRDLPLHVGSLIATGTLKAAIKGYGKGPFTGPEMEQAKAYIREGLEAGAAGLSMGIMYQPECYSARAEIQELISAAAPFGGPLACHIRGEGDNLVSSVKEVIEVTGAAGVPLNISHFKATGVKNWGSEIYKAIELIDAARAAGQDVTVDFYPYCGGSTTLISLLPPAVMEDSVEMTLKKLGTERGKEELRREIYREHTGWDNMVTAIGWERILLSSVTKEANRKFTGKNFREAASLAGYEEPADFCSDLLAEEQGKVGIIVLSMSQEDVDTVARLPYSMVISDSLYGVSDCPHPRLYGSFPKIIREYVRERGVLTMEEAVKKMTLLPAKRLSLEGRGMIKEGYHADINVFDPEKVRDYAVYENPKQLCRGFRMIMVDGTIAVSDDLLLKRNCGSVIKL